MKTEKELIHDAIDQTQAYFNSPRFKGVKRLFSARQVVEQQGTIYNDYSIAKEAAAEFYKVLRSKFDQKKQITTFGPYTPSQAVQMKRSGIEGIYLGGWATSAKGSQTEDPGADLASYPLSQVPDEAAGIVRALVTADKNQRFQRLRLPEKERANQPIIDFRPFIIADADTGHGGDAHVRNLIRRFVEAGVPGYHIEDQKPGTKKCGHQGGKVLVSCDEQIKRINTARLQLDTMRVQGLIVARTDAEAASLIENIADERDQPFVLGATNLNIPSYKYAFLELQRHLNGIGATDIRGHELYQVSEMDQAETRKWLQTSGVLKAANELTTELNGLENDVFEKAYSDISTTLVTIWEKEAGVTTYGDAVSTIIEERIQAGEAVTMTVEEWMSFAKTASLKAAQIKATTLGIDVKWNCEMARTPEGYYQVKGGIPFAIAKSLAVAPYADLLWMETKTADLEDARMFAEAVHELYPDQMLAYNLSPSFNWDTTGMSEEQMSNFPDELGKLGFVFNFITYGGHQIDGLATDEFSNSLQTEGMLALAKVQRKLRLLDSPYRTPQSLVGGPRLDSALAASSGRTATTKAMGKGSTQFQHLKQTELPKHLLAEWVDTWKTVHDIREDIQVSLKPHLPGSSIMELALMSDQEKLANIVFTVMTDRNKLNLLSVRDQNTFHKSLRRKRLMTLLHLFLIKRYVTFNIHYLTPTMDNSRQCEGMKRMKIYDDFSEEVGYIIVANVNKEAIENDVFIDEILNKEAVLT